MREGLSGSKLVWADETTVFPRTFLSHYVRVYQRTVHETPTRNNCQRRLPPDDSRTISSIGTIIEAGGEIRWIRCDRRN